MSPRPGYGSSRVVLVTGSRPGTSPVSVTPFDGVAAQAAWTADAACQGLDIPTGRVSEDGMEVETIFHPLKGGSTRQAKKICASCPVRVECTDDAIATPAGQDFGIRGGLTQRQRAEMRRSGTPTCPDCGADTELNARGRALLCDDCRATRRRATHERHDRRRAA